VRRHARETSAGSSLRKARPIALPAVALAALLGTLVVLVALASAAAPVVVTGSASNVQKTSATLNGTVNPEGTELEECFFEYGPTTTYGQTADCVETPAAIGSGTSPVSVHADLSGLGAASRYHFRLVAINEAAEKRSGSDQTFATLGPLVGGELATKVGTTSATLNAVVNPNGKLTTYRFEYIDETDFQVNGFANAIKKPVPDASAGAGATDVAVSIALSNLQPSTIYHFRLVATNPDAASNGAGATFETFSPPSTFSSCPNDQFRTGASAALPDCRAYEQASPLDKNGLDVGGDLFHKQASVDGNSVIFQTNSGIPGGVGAEEFPMYVASRNASNWSVRGALPPPSFGWRAQVGSWSPDLGLVYDKVATFSPAVGEPLQGTLVAGSADGSFHQFLPFAPGISRFVAATSADDSKVIFEATVTGGALPVTNGPTPASGKVNLYLWDRDTDAITLVGVLPPSEGGGAPVNGSYAGPFDWWGTSTPAFNRGGITRGYFTQALRSISDSGDGAIFSAGSTPAVYLRKGLTGPSPETVKVSASQRTIPDPNGTKAAAFMSASSDGSIVFFTSCEKLTDDSTAVSTATNKCNTESQGQDLYAYDVASGVLSDLTVDAADPNGANVQGVVGTSEDGSYVYFVANGDLDGTGPAVPGNCQIEGGSSYHGFCNLYLWHGGVITFIAPLDTEKGGEALNPRGDMLDWAPASDTGSGFSDHPTGFVSDDGRTVVFRSQNRLTTYDNKGIPEYYRFHVGDQGLTCITCSPTGAPPTGRPTVTSIRIGAVKFATAVPLLQHNLSANGDQFFFETPDKLVAGDTNGDHGCPPAPSNGSGTNPACQDVYEWEAEGAGTCETPGGCIHLLSAGAGPNPSFIADASASGRDVFIFTREALVPQDRDQVQDIYDVRVGGGLASQYPVPPPPPCEGEGCRGPASDPPRTRGTGSAVFSGPGNPIEVRRRSCDSAARDAQKLSRLSKRLYRRASHAHDPRLARRLRDRSEQLAKRAGRASRDAKRCRRNNRRAAR
jgi:hypothetical protein